MKSVKSNGAARYNIFDAAGTLLQVFDADAGTRTDYVPGPNGALARVSRTLSADTLTYIHADHLGTGRVGTDAAGAVKWEDYHTPFGESLIHPDATDDQGDFTGHIRDSGSGLTYMQARYYDPIAGRFLSIDPVTMMHTGNPAHFNRYAYANNDPVNMVDLDGRVSSRVWTSPTDLTVYIRFNIVDPSGVASYSATDVARQVASDFSGTTTIGGVSVNVTAVGQNIGSHFAAAEEKLAGTKTNIVTANGSHTDATTGNPRSAMMDGVGGVDIQMNPTDGAIVVSHELGHGAGAGINTQVVEM